MANPFLGLLLLTVSGLAGGSFYVPFGKVKAWSWETYWLAQGVMAWLVMPLLAVWYVSPDLAAIFTHSPVRSIVFAFVLGAMWGVGSAAYGLSIRYLGISLGTTSVLGICAALGTLLPPLVDGRFGQLFVTFSGWFVLTGVLVCLLGIASCGYAGFCKERELTDRQKQESVKEFALWKGFVAAIVSGVISASLPYGIYAGKPIAQVALDLGIAPAYQNTPVFLVVTLGGLAVNIVYCLTLGVRNGSLRQYAAGSGVLLMRNYALVGLAGVLWYLGTFFYGMGMTTLGKYDFAAWSISMALGIVFSTLWGLALKEWKGIGPRTWWFLEGGIAALILSTFMIGTGSHLATMVDSDVANVRYSTGKQGCFSRVCLVSGRVTGH
jgi:L-rhamnose-H+ transport protein